MAQKRLRKKVTFTSSDTPSLTKTELEVLHYITEQYMTPKQVAIRRQTGTAAVRKIIKKLKEKGVLNQHLEKVTKKVSTRLLFPKIRLHAEEFNIKILYKDDRYKNLYIKSNIMQLDGNTIRLYKDSLEIYSGQYFYGDDTKEIAEKASRYWQHLFTKLENKLKIIIIKEGYHNIKKVNEHYAEINNELAKDMHKKGEKLRLFDKEDGKTWLSIDNSHGLHELECMHPEKAKQDIEKIKPILDDMRQNPILISDVLSTIKLLAEQNKETASGLNAVVTLIKGNQPEEVKENEQKDRKIPEYIN